MHLALRMNASMLFVIPMNEAKVGHLQYCFYNLFLVPRTEKMKKKKILKLSRKFNIMTQLLIICQMKISIEDCDLRTIMRV